MEILTITAENDLLIANSTENENTSPPKSGNKESAQKPTHSEEQELYYKESIIINYQRYKALFRSKLIAHILIDEKNIIRDFNKKAKENFGQFLSKDIKIGNSIASWFEVPHYGTIFQKALQTGLNEMIEFEFTDLLGEKHRFHLEIILFISPSDNRLLKCISAVKIN